MKKAILIGIYTIYPLLLIVIYTLLGNMMYYGGDGYYNYTDNKVILFGLLAVFYISPFCGFYYFAKKRPFNQWLLFVGFIPAPVFLLIYDYINPPSLYQYLLAGVVTSFYTVPFVIISVIFALVITIKDNRTQ